MVVFGADLCVCERVCALLLLNTHHTIRCNGYGAMDAVQWIRCNGYGAVDSVQRKKCGDNTVAIFAARYNSASAQWIQRNGYMYDAIVAVQWIQRNGHSASTAQWIQCNGHNASHLQRHRYNATDIQCIQCNGESVDTMQWCKSQRSFAGNSIVRDGLLET